MHKGLLTSEALALQNLQGLMTVQYVTHFPKGEVYVSIIKSAESPEAQKELDEKRARLRALVKESLAEEAMLAEPDEGRRRRAPESQPAQVRFPQH